jgi:hypothetical protein
MTARIRGVPRSGAGLALLVWSLTLALALVGCGGEADDATRNRAPVTRAPVDPATYAGDVALKTAQTYRVGDTNLPFTLYVGLSPASETRLAVKAFVDLRPLQTELPAIASRSIDASCSLALDFDVDDAVAERETVRASGSVLATLYRCRSHDTENEHRGMRLWSQRIDFVAAATAGIERDCVAFRLADLDLRPRGLIGGVATLIGLTERARVAILDRGGAFLKDNPVCPKLPETLVMLDPQYVTGGLREIGDGGVGAALSGSVDASAGTVIRLLAELRTRGILGEVR